MKATLDIPDDLYRRVKARGAIAVGAAVLTSDAHFRASKFCA
jgi:hypothetical protein